MTVLGFAGHASATANSLLTFHLAHSVGADQSDAASAGAIQMARVHISETGASDRLSTVPFLAVCMAIVLIAAALRFTGLSLDLPFIYHPDEPGSLVVVQNMLRGGTADPANFMYPSLFYYLHVPGQLVVQAISGQLQGFTMQSMGNGFTPQPAAFLAGRVTTACLGTALVACAMLLTREITGSRWAILLTGALAAFNPLLVAQARMMTPNTPMALAVTLALIAAVRVANSATLPGYVFGGVMTGVAASLKYNGGLVGVAIAAGHFANRGLSASHFGRLVWAGLVSIAAFLLTSPFLVVDFPASFTAGIIRQWHIFQTGHAGYEGHALTFYLGWLWAMFGAPVLLIAASALHPARLRLIPIAFFSAAYFTLLSIQVVRFERELLPLVPALIVLVGIGFESIRLSLHRRKPQSLLRDALLVILAAAVVASGLGRTAAEMIASHAVDPRRDARAWISQHVAPRTSIMEDSYTIFADPKIYRVSGVSMVLKEKMPAIEKNDVVVVSRRGSGRFLRGGRGDESGKFRRLGELACERKTFNDAAGRASIWVFRLHC